MKKICGRTPPKARLKGAVLWDSAWGAQDNRYRFFLGPPDAVVHEAVKAFWEKR